MADLLAARIESGELAPRKPIPSEVQIAQQYAIGRGTARRAVDLLVERGLVIKVQGRGTFVVERNTDG